MSEVIPNSVTPTLPVQQSDLVQKVVFAFNKILADFILSAKTQSPEVKALLRASYRFIESGSPAHVERLRGLLTPEHIQTLKSDDALLLTELAQLSILEGCTVHDISSRCAKTYAGHELKLFVYTLSLLAMVYSESVSAPDNGNNGVSPLLLEQVLRAVAAAQRGGGDEDDSLEDESLDEKESVQILDDDYLAILENMKRVANEGRDADEYDDDDDEEDEEGESNTGKPAEDSENPENSGNSANSDPKTQKTKKSSQATPELDKIMSSKIGQLAAEISQEIDPSQLDVENPMELLDLKKLADGSSPLGSIIAKVGGKIQDKIRAGELSQSELLGEAMSMLSLFNNPNSSSSSGTPGSSSSKKKGGRPDSSRGSRRHGSKNNKSDNMAAGLQGMLQAMLGGASGASGSQGLPEGLGSIAALLGGAVPPRK